MTLVLPQAAPKKASLGQRLSAGVGQGLQVGQQLMQQHQQNQAISERFPELAGLPPEMQKAGLTELLRGQRGLTPLQQSQKELADQRLKSLQSNQTLFQKLSGEPNQQENDLNKQSHFSQEDQDPLSKVSDEDLIKISAFAGQPGEAGVFGNIAKQSLDNRRENKKRERAEVLDFHKESAKYDEELNKNLRISKNQIESFENIEKALKSGNVHPGSWTNILKGFGQVGSKISDAIQNKDEATLLASIPQLLEGWKQVFGVRLSDADLRVLQDKLPSIGKTPEANRSVLKIMRKYAEMSQLRGQIGKDIKKSNKGLRPLGYADMIEERFDEMVKPIKVVNPKTGNLIDIPAYKVGDAIKAGAYLPNE